MIEPHQQALEKVQISHAPLNKENGYNLGVTSLQAQQMYMYN